MKDIALVKPILIIGGTGNIGRQVITRLTATGRHIRALVRDPDAAHLPPEVVLIRGDLTCPDTLDPCLADVETVFLVWTAPPSAVTAALERIARHARRIVFLSAPLKTPHPFFQQPNPSRVVVEDIERTIETSGLEWTILRPGIFALNARHFWGPQIRAGDVVHWPYLSAPTAPVDERDIAAVAVRTLTEPGHAAMEYVLTGPQSLSQYEQIATIGTVLGRNLHIQEVSADAARRVWLSAMPSPVLTKLLDAWAAAVGQPAFVTDTIQELTGQPARTFRDWVVANEAIFRAAPAATTD
jgi:uncharacterized protein YbjT (DUF2867 family)